MKLVCFEKLIENIILIMLSISYAIFANSMNSQRFCDKNYIDSVLWDGLTYRILKDKSIGVYSELNESVIELRDYNSSFVTEAQYYISDAPNYECKVKQLPVCLQLKKMKHLLVSLMHNTKTGAQYMVGEHYLPNKSEVIPDPGIPFNDIEQLWPNSVQYNTQPYKIASYWPKHSLLIYIIKVNHKTVLATRSLEVIEWTKGWSYDEISEPKNMTSVYITSFWWNRTDNVYIVVENKEKPERNGYVYQLNRDFKNPFIPIGQKVIEFFGCKIDDESEGKEVINSKETGKSKDLYIIIGIAFLFVVIISIFVFLIIYWSRKLNKANTVSKLSKSSNLSTKSKSKY